MVQDCLSDLPPDEAAVLRRMVGFVDDASASSIALRTPGLAVAHKDGDLGQALTQADERISVMMSAAFGPRLIEEETASAWTSPRVRQTLAERDWTFIGDPIDGTKPFAGGLPGWGTMIAACRDGWPVASVIGLPAWVDERDRPGLAMQAAPQRGLLIAAAGARSFCSPMVDGRMTGPLRPLLRPPGNSYHIGWLPVAAQNFTLDYCRGFFPWCESGVVSDAASLATGRLAATTFNAKLWDLAPVLPIYRAAGMTLFGWPDLRPPPDHILDMFDDDFTSGEALWIAAPDAPTARRIAEAIRRA